MMFLFSLIGVLVVSLTAFGVVEFRRIGKLKAVHKAFADTYGLEVRYASGANPLFQGNYKNYPVHTGLERIGGKQMSFIRIPMINPNKKTLIILQKNSTIATFLPDHSDQYVRRQQGMFEEGVSALTNDMMFSGLILTDSVKEQVNRHFPAFGGCMLYIAGEDLKFITSDEIWIYLDAGAVGGILDLMCNMKGELNFSS